MGDGRDFLKRAVAEINRVQIDIGPYVVAAGIAQAYFKALGLALSGGLVVPHKGVALGLGHLGHVGLPEVEAAHGVGAVAP